MKFCKMNNTAQRHKQAMTNVPLHSKPVIIPHPFIVINLKKWWVDRLVCHQIAFSYINELPGDTILST